MKRVFIIAEAGVNHNGSLDEALKLIDIASISGADAIKFQTFEADKLSSKETPKAKYQEAQTNQEESQYEMLKNLELSQNEFKELKDYSEFKNIEFMSTPFDLDSLYFLDDLGMNLIKVPSGELINLDFLFSVARLNKKIFLSTGMATEDEIEDALAVIEFSHENENRPENLDELHEFKKEHLNYSSLKDKVVLLQCTSSYPCEDQFVNSSVISSFKNKYKIEVGFSDHSLGYSASLLAVAQGATVLEKHFTRDKNNTGPDHSCSLNPIELEEFVSLVRKSEIQMGNSEKSCTLPEEDTRRTVRKRIVSTKSINKGENFTRENISLLRSEKGKEAKYFWDLLNKESVKSYEAGEPIE